MCRRSLPGPDAAVSTQRLAGRTVAVPETREIEVFAALLERRGANVIRCPMIAIHDAPDPAPVLQWSRRLAAGGFDDLILFTGEGLRRILSCIERHEPPLRHGFLEALSRIRKVTRGPKPAKALRELGLKPDMAAERATTEGVIATLRSRDLHGRRIGVQLYGTEPNRKLIDFIRQAGAEAFPVAPYIYASEADDRRVIAFIRQLAQGEIDVIAFTSAQQVTRLRNVAKANRLEEALDKGWSRTKIAAVGPVVAETLKNCGVRIDMMPQESYFMKPLVNTIVAAFTA